MDAPTAECDHVGVRVRRRQIIYSADLTLQAGVSGLIGPNGAGKTTLIRALATAIPISQGHLRIFGTDIRGRKDLADLRRRIGYAAQQPVVLNHLTVIEQVAYVGWLKGLPSDAALAGAEESLALVDLAGRSTSKVRSLSGGMLRRLGIAMAIVHNPDLILLDEPTAGLDPDQRDGFRRLVTELGRSRTVLLSTHLLEDVASVCSHVAVLLGGRTVFQGTVAALAARADKTGDDAAPTIHQGYAALTGAGR